MKPRSPFLRSAGLVALSALALPSMAQVRYTLSDPSSSLWDFTYVAPDLVTNNTPLERGQLESADPSTFLVLFGTTNRPNTPAPYVAVNRSGAGERFYFFEAGAFTTPGLHTAANGGTLTVAPVPEPASMAALGLGLAAVVRRRKRA